MKIYLIISLVILSLFTVGFLVYVLILLRKDKQNKLMIGKLSSSLKYNFNDDMEYLLYLIDYKCTIYINLTLKPLSSIKDNKFLTDADLNNAVEEIVVGIMNCLSDGYKQIIYKYFTVDGFKTYLVELVYNTLTVYISKDNASKIKSMNRSFNLNKKENEQEPIGRQADID